MKHDFIIVGGGVAGLSAANHLAERGADVALLESGSYPAHKICGEFLSPEAIPILERWGIQPASTIESIQIQVGHRETTMEIPMTATLSRYKLEQALARRASDHGAQIMTNCRVDSIETFDTKHLLVSTGRLGNHPPKFRYTGVKAHFEGITIPKQLVMCLMPGAYFGLAPIGENRVNIAGIISSKEPLESFLNTEPLASLLKGGRCLFDEWMVAPVPEFGVRSPPAWENAFFLGDAMGVIPPATGNGVTMALTSGVLAAEYALKGDPIGYRKAWRENYAQCITKGKLLHRLLLSSRLCKVVSALPKVPKLLYSLLR